MKKLHHYRGSCDKNSGGNDRPFSACTFAKLFLVRVRGFPLGGKFSGLGHFPSSSSFPAKAMHKVFGEEATQGQPCFRKVASVNHKLRKL